MAVTQYIGARYVPMFSDPLDWDSTKAYEPLTIVYYLGNSYTSRQSVPAGIDIANTDYWAITGNYNAQIEAYRKEVQTYDGRITENAQAIADEVSRAVAEEAAIKELITAETTRAKAAESELATGVSNAITRVSEEAIARESADSALIAKIERSRFVKDYDRSVLVCVGDSILAGWSNENPSGIDAWDVYAGDRLGFKPSNVIKSCIGGAGWSTGTTGTNLIIESLATVQSAGHAASDVTVVCIGLGVNDSRSKASALNVKEGIEAALNKAISLYPSAEIHVFPCIMGNFGYNSYTQNVITSCHDVAATKPAVTVHEGSWTWNYDAARSGVVSSDRVHLLEAGLKKVGYNIAAEIQGYNTTVNSATYNVSDVTGATRFTAKRSGTATALTLCDNYTTSGSGNPLLLGVPNQYINGKAFHVVWDASRNQSTMLFADGSDETIKSYIESFTKRGLYGTMAWTIDNDWKWIE